MTPHELALKEEALQYRRRFRSWYKETRTSGFPNGFLTKEFQPLLAVGKLGPMALRIYIYLLLCANDGGEAWHAVPKMAEDLGVSVRQVQRGVAELAEKRLVAKVKYSQKRTTRFFLLPYGQSAVGQQKERS